MRFAELFGNEAFSRAPVVFILQGSLASGFTVALIVK
jgi:hypothetical protein